MPSGTITQVITTVFSTRCWKNARLELAAWLACVFFAFAPLAPAHADPAPAEVSQFQLQSDADGVYLTASVRFQLSAIVEDALRKGIPMFFVAEADVLRDRWYWYDKRVASVARHMRLAYQPLTRGWRLNVSPDVISDVGLGLTLNQNFDSLADALAAIQRISHWKIANTADLEPDGRYSVEFRFRLDVSQLPRPFQIGAVGESDWTISASRQQRLVLENKR
ncbi:MAG: DUF4390 domain-containing protein [Burkholderiaceae bacterium]|nr:DUF4390 domain-containing protein [Burkholderiales bacterium]TAL73651.1 MAG: DUF4390 domain-containing protein [Burkholderiaceae bacterium]TBR76278.1 MAG: DUF4390 domain-containing protein [Burkholderiaceae bacterium]